MKGGSIMMGFEMENFFDVNVATTFVENVLALLEIEGIYTQQALALMKHLKTNKNDEHAKRAATRKRCRKHMVDADEFVASNSEALLISRSSRKWFTTVSYVNGFKGFPTLWYKQWELTASKEDLPLGVVNNKDVTADGFKGDTNYSVSLKYIEVSDCACRLDWYLLDVVKWVVVQVRYVCILDEVMNHIILDEVGESDAERGECFLELERDCPE
ncbi:hypothetical protein Tco_0868541, partial [Tanacetum coccineum]